MSISGWVWSDLFSWGWIWRPQAAKTYPQKDKSDQTHPEIDMLDLSSPGWVQVVSLWGWVAGHPGLIPCRDDLATRNLTLGVG